MVAGQHGRELMNKLKGKIFSALVTPMHSDESINFGLLEDLVEHQLKEGVEGFYCCGSSGEALLLSLEERKKITQTVVKVVDGRVPVIAHVGTIRTSDVIELGLAASKAGVVAISMIPPYYYKFSLEEVFNYYFDVIKRVGAPVVIYNIPQFTNFAFNKDNARDLLNDERVIGIKHTSQDFYMLERMKEEFPNKIYFNGFDETYLAAMAAGASGTVGTTVNLFAPLFKAIRDNFNKGDLLEAQRLQTKLNRYIEIFVKHGIFSSVKFALTLKGFPSGTCRLPFKPLTNEAREAIKGVLSHIDRQV